MADLGIRGRRLLSSLEHQDPTLAETGNPMREVAVSAGLCADRLERLEDLAVEVEPWIEGERGKLLTHPVLIEVRQQAALLARLVTTLRLPDPKTGKRPQGRPLRGVHGAPKVSSLERARERAEGNA